MKLVVTGALGHIGSHVVRDLAVRFPGVEIIMIDNMMTQRYGSLFNLPATGNYRFHEADITRIDLCPVVTGAHAVIHLAAITDAAGSFGRAAEVEQNNYQCTARLAEICAETGARLIALSSTSVYGTQAAIVSEDCSPEELKPQSPYAETKLKEEELVTSLTRANRLRGISLRFGTIFGASPGMRFHTAVNKFCWQAVMGQPLTVWRTAYEQKRPYLDLVDAGRALAHILEKDIFDGRIYNVLTLNAAVRDIVGAIESFVPDLKVDFVDNKIMNQLSYEVSRDRFAGTGFNFAGDLTRGVGETIALLKNSNGRI
jgi:nucleoside-diphosphate-sugar epimerase